MTRFPCLTPTCSLKCMSLCFQCLALFFVSVSCPVEARVLSVSCSCPVFSACSVCACFCVLPHPASGSTPVVISPGLQPRTIFCVSPAVRHDPHPRPLQQNRSLGSSRWVICVGLGFVNGRGCVVCSLASVVLGSPQACCSLVFLVGLCGWQSTLCNRIGHWKYFNVLRVGWGKSAGW